MLILVNEKINKMGETTTHDILLKVIFIFLQNDSTLSKLDTSKGKSIDCFTIENFCYVTLPSQLKVTFHFDRRDTLPH